MSRLTKIDRMTAEEKKALIDSFHVAPGTAEFSPEALALACNFSLPWLQKKRSVGGGIPFSKPNRTTVLYRKQDVLDYIEASRLKHTA